MKKLYIDITESYVWTGKVTGIIRVMDEVARRFNDNVEVSPQFIVWDEKTKFFRGVDFADLLERRRKDQLRKSLKVTPESTQTNRTGFKIPLSRTFNKTLKYLPKRTVSTRRSSRIRLEDNSLLFMPHGGVWASSSYRRTVIALQKEQHISLAMILYDLCPVISPQFCSEGIRRTFNQHMRTMLVKSDVVLAISENTAKDAKEWIRSIGAGSISRTSLFRLGDEISAGIGIQPHGIRNADKFVLCVGTIEARKNHTCLYYAYKLAAQRGIDLPPVIIAGRKGWLANDIYETMLSDPDAKDKFIFIHDASDKELTWLYENALFSVYPSFYEGWGLPVAESLLRGVPSIASNSSSIPEIAPNLVDYFSPYSPEELLYKMQAMSKQKAQVTRRRQIKDCYKTTTWDESYEQIRKVLDKI